MTKIKEATGDSIHAAFDTVSTEASQELTIKTFASGPGKLLVILAPSKAAQDIRPDVLFKVRQDTHFQMTSLKVDTLPIPVTLIYTSLGRAFDYRGIHYPASPEAKNHMVEFLKKTPELVTSGAIKPNPVKLWSGGLETVHEGLDYLKEGKNSGEKVVYRIA